MNAATRDVYELRLRIRFLEDHGEAFQDLFSRVMELAYPGDFVRVRPWGSDGDEKNDGYLRSTRTLYQVYAPSDLSKAAAVKKIKDDFAGALMHWDEYLDRWTFVHNALKGVGPHILHALQELEEQNPGRPIQHFGPIELREVLFSLKDEDIASLLGPPLDPPPPSGVAFEEIKTVLDHVTQFVPPMDGPVAEVEPGKLNANRLNANSRSLLMYGMSVAPRVASFLAEYTYDPELGDRVAGTLKAEYARMRGQGMGANEIFSRLFSFVNAHRATSEAAAMAVLGYFFERCDIFEAAPIGNNLPG